jgi:hypothetical protein
MAIQGNITEVTIVGGNYAGPQAVKTPYSTIGETREFLRHLASELIQSNGHGKEFRFVDCEGAHQINRQDITSITITFS